MKIGALFCDYDGTLAPIEARREDSRVPRDLEKTLRELSGKAAVAIVTTKDYAFIHPRTGFARGWACVGGLEVRVGNKVLTRGNLADLGRALEAAEALDGNGVLVETKRGGGGEILGLCVDWTGGRRPPEEGLSKVSEAAGDGAFPVMDEGGRFLDVFAQKPNKGRAVRELKRLLGVDGGVMFIGDSAEDNSAFKEADVAVGVSYGQPLDGLKCAFLVNQDELAHLLGSVADGGMEFSPRGKYVRRKEG